jgi:uncharacterized sodium:solute symporter family permease YidK
MGLTSIDWLIMAVYSAFVIGIGVVLKRYTKTSTDFFLAGRSIPAWVCGLAFISPNLGAQEVLGMAASGAKYGIATSHFYWIGAIPAMVFIGIFMMPFYYGSRAEIGTRGLIPPKMDDVSRSRTRSETQPAKPIQACFSFSWLPTPSLRRKVIMGHQLVKPD